jgi:hypothetical protein
LIINANAAMLRAKEFPCGGFGWQGFEALPGNNLVPVYGRDLTGRKAVSVASVHV